MNEAFSNRPLIDLPSRSLFIRRIALLLTTAALAVLAAGSPGYAKTCRAIIVKSADLKPYQDALRGFEDATRCDVREVRSGDVAELEDMHLSSHDVVVAIGTTAFKKVKALKNPAIVYIMVISSEADRDQSPNISGVSMDIAPAAVLKSIKEVIPSAKKIGLLYNSRYTLSYVNEAKQAARSAGINLAARQVHDPSEIVAALDEMHDGMDVLWMLPDPTVVSEETVDYMLRYSIQHSIPIFTFSKKYVDMGAIASLGMDPYDMGGQAAEVVERIMKGEGDGDGIRVYPRAARLSINVKAAEKMGLKIRDEVLRKVGKVE
jgi:putative ABC transport system substrate-binding protein